MANKTDHTVTDIPSAGPLRRVKVRRYPDGKVWITIYGAGQRFAITSAYLDRKGGAEVTIVPVR
jgi:hypothetical protein